MTRDIHDLFADLDELRARADAAFGQVAQAHPAEVTCAPGCDDCCHAVFDLTPMEALAIGRAFAALPREARRAARRRGDKAAKAFDQLVARAAKSDDRLAEYSRARIACPLLEGGRCLLYAHRPITCRLYGVPVAIGGASRTCGRSGFAQGRTYPSVDYGQINARLEQMSDQALRLLGGGLPPMRLDMARALEWAEANAAELRQM